MSGVEEPAARSLPSDALAHELTNRQGGMGSVARGWQPLPDLIARYEARPTDITEDVLLLIIRKQWNPPTADQHLYEWTRGWWKVGWRRYDVTHGLAVVNGIVRGCFRINGAQSRNLAAG